MHGDKKASGNYRTSKNNDAKNNKDGYECV
jgi:hypothetical protein